MNDHFKSGKFGICLLFIVSSCGISRQTKQIKAFEKCTFRIIEAKQLRVAGADIKKIIDDQKFELSSLPGVAVGLLTKNVPLRASLSVEITNPTQETAAINQFEYRVLVGKEEIANGLVNQPISAAPGQKVIVPIDINSNIYALVSNPDILNGISKAVKQRKGSERLGVLTFKLKPTIMFGGGSYKYPGYITISKDINSEIFR